MGLDMYLYAEYYPLRGEKKQILKKAINSRKSIPKIGELKSTRSLVMQWRKANSIHKWFVDNVQDGADDCSTSYVSHDRLKELLSLCEKVIATAKIVDGDVVSCINFTREGIQKEFRPGKIISNAEEIADILPTQNGFFFGCTDYDEGYIEDIKYTADELKSIIEHPKFDEFDFYYMASW